MRTDFGPEWPARHLGNLFDNSTRSVRLHELYVVQGIVLVTVALARGGDDLVIIRAQAPTELTWIVLILVDLEFGPPCLPWAPILVADLPSAGGSGTRGGGGDSAEQTSGAEVLVDLGPVDAFAVSNEPPIAPRSSGGVEQAWVPDQGHREGAAVRESDDELVGGSANLL